MSEHTNARGGVEWITLGMIVAVYALWAITIFWLAGLALWLAIPIAALVIALHSSLTHEVLHGHPFGNRALNEATMFLPLNLCVPFNRFRDLHLAHHRDANLTDPYDDPESNYLDPAIWTALPRWKRELLSFNNTLFGRVTVGAGIGHWAFMRDEWRGARRGDRAIWLAWGLHFAGAGIVLALVLASAMPLWAYLIAAYAALSILRIRTYLEHRAHDKVRGRTVIIEDNGPLAWMFLHNNLHVVHHMNPSAPWYDLPALYRQGKARYLACNEAYVYRSYGQIFRAYFFKAKDPVPHPLWPQQ